MQEQYENFPRRVLVLWEILSLCAAALLFILAYYLLNHYHIVWYITVWLIGALEVLCGFLYLPLLYTGCKYVVRDEEIVLQRGVFFHKTHYLVRNKITFVTLYHDPISSLFSLSTLIITAPGANLVIPFMSRKRASELAGQLSYHHNFQEI